MLLVERNVNEIVLRLPADTDIFSVQRVLEYFKYKQAIKKSKATEKDAEQLATELKTNWWEENKNRFIK
ncbi:MAG: hypothetical protein KGV44_10210 [Flavobacteriaceae bacterium]|nr:hypothetical protein [Flavobacteriaceae bacterium]